MERFQYDRGSKWPLDHHGNMILFLGQVRDIAEWRTRQAEIVQPRQLPDGLLEVRRQQEARFHPYIVEIETYAERSAPSFIGGTEMFEYFSGIASPTSLGTVGYPWLPEGANLWNSNRFPLVNTGEDYTARRATTPARAAKGEMVHSGLAGLPYRGRTLSGCHTPHLVARSWLYGQPSSCRTLPPQGILPAIIKIRRPLLVRGCSVPDLGGVPLQVCLPPASMTAWQGRDHPMCAITAGNTAD